jgi:hypothetical protein
MKSLTKMQAAGKMESLIGGMDDAAEEAPTAAKNVANRAKVIKNWALGPTKASVEPAANSEYWQQMADLWEIDEAQARRQLCANCEYFDNTPAMQENMESVPLDKFDRDGGGRGYCVKFDFICHNLRVCQAWEEKPFAEPEDEAEVED